MQRSTTQATDDEEQSSLLVSCHNTPTAGCQWPMKMNNFLDASSLEKKVEMDEGSEPNTPTTSNPGARMVGGKEEDASSKHFMSSKDCVRCDGLRNILEQTKRKLNDSGKLIMALRSTIAARESFEERNKFLDHLLALLEEHESIADQKELHFMMQLVASRIRKKKEEGSRQTNRRSENDGHKTSAL